MERIEDIIAAAVNAADYEYDGEKCLKYAEFTSGNIEGNISVDYDWHSVEDWQNFEWGRSLVQTDDVVDEIRSVDVECWDDSTGEDVMVDKDYLISKIEL